MQLIVGYQYFFLYIFSSFEYAPKQNDEYWIWRRGANFCTQPLHLQRTYSFRLIDCCVIHFGWWVLVPFGRIEPHTHHYGYSRDYAIEKVHYAPTIWSIRVAYFLVSPHFRKCYNLWRNRTQIQTRMDKGNGSWGAPITRWATVLCGMVFISPNKRQYKWRWRRYTPQTSVFHS